MRTSLLPTLLAALLAVPATAQEPPKPGAEHKQLLAAVGTWNAVIEMTDQAGTPTTSKGVSKLTAGPGGFWIVDDFQAQMMGAPFTGHGTTGYDQTKGKYVGTWIDSWSSSVMVLEGTYDAAKKALTMSGMAPGMDGKPVLHTMVTTDKDANTRVFEMFLPGPEGKAMKVMTITYTRADKK